MEKKWDGSWLDDNVAKEWLSMPGWSQGEALSLLQGIVPKGRNTNDPLPNFFHDSNRDPAYQPFMRAMAALSSVEEPNSHERLYSPRDVIALAKTHRIDLCDYWEAVLANQNPSDKDDSSDFTRLARNLDAARALGEKLYDSLRAQHPTINLPATAQQVLIRQVPGLIADALWPEVPHDTRRPAIIGVRERDARDNMKALSHAIRSGVLRAMWPNRTPFTDPPVSDDLAGLNVFVQIDELRNYLKPLGIGLQLGTEKIGNEEPKKYAGRPKEKVDFETAAEKYAEEFYKNGATDNPKKIVKSKAFIERVFLVKNPPIYGDTNSLTDQKYNELYKVGIRKMTRAVSPAWRAAKARASSTK